ncbi:hypothetical protein K8I61_03670 [bacterium]|nr:hypothetical protein [bacterium]
MISIRLATSARLFALLTCVCALTAVAVGCSCGDDDDDDDGTGDLPAVDDDTANGDDDNFDDDTADDDDIDDDDADDDTSDDDNDDDADDDTGDDDTDPGDAIEPTAGFLSRCEDWLQDCFDVEGPPNGDNHGQVCRLAIGGEMDIDAVEAQLDRAWAREDTVDFSLTSIMRMMYLYADSPHFPAQLQSDITDAFLGFKYWPDEGGPDSTIFWSENHEILYLALELLAGQMWEDETFTNAGLTGTDHIEKATARLHDWMDMRFAIGMTEWHSNVYYNEDVPALLNLYDFAEDETIREKAAILLDLLAFDMAINSYRGYLATTHGRTYEDKLMGRGSDSMRTLQYVWFGTGGYNPGSHFSAGGACTSDYVPPLVFEGLANDDNYPILNRQRTGIDVLDGPDYGLTYDDPDDVMFWWSMSAYIAPEVVQGTLATIDAWNLWDGYFSFIDFLEPLALWPIWEPIARLVEPMAYGTTLESVNTYTWRTADGQVSSGVDYNKGYWAAQQHMWNVTLDRDATVFTTYPGGLEDDYAAGDWTGGWLPRIGQIENVLVAIYDRETIDFLEDILFKDYTHAYFPKNAFDEWEQNGNWIFGKKGDGYIALWSRTTPAFADTGPEAEYELIADSFNNVWIMEFGRAAQFGSFADFKTDILAAAVSVNGDLDVSYDSPTQGLITFGWDDPFVAGGDAVDLGPYPRFDNPYAQTPWGAEEIVIAFGGDELQLEFDPPRRRLFLAD